MQTYKNSTIITEYRSKSRSIPDTAEFDQVIDYIASPESVNKMICASELGYPALTGICRDLCEFCNDFSKFSLSDYTNRQHVGRIIKFVLARYGYAPKSKGLDPQCRIPACAQTNPIIFQTSAVYEKIPETPMLSLKVFSISNESIKGSHMIEAAAGNYRLNFNTSEKPVTMQMIKTLLDPILVNNAEIISGFSLETCTNTEPPCSLILRFRPDDIKNEQFTNLMEEIDRVFSSFNLTLQEAPYSTYFKSLWITSEK